MELLKADTIINKENIDIENFDYKIVQILRPMGFEAWVFHIYIDDFDCDSEAIDLLVDYAVKHDKEIDRTVKWNMTLTDKEIEEFEAEDTLEEYTSGGNDGSYLNWAIELNHYSIHDVKRIAKNISSTSRRCSKRSL